MPTPPVTATVVQIAMKGLMAAAGSQSVKTVFLFHFRRSTGAGAPSKANIDAAFQAAIATPIAAALNNRWAATVDSLRFLNSALDGDVDFSSALIGLISGDSMPSDQAAYLLMRTGVRGKSYRGSKHLGPMSESDTTTTGDVFNAGALTRLSTIAAAILAGFTDSDGNVWKPSVVSTSLSQLRTDPVTIIANDAAQVSVNHRVGSMNRRKTASVY